MNPPHTRGQPARETVQAAARAAAISTIRDAIERVAAQASETQAREGQTEGLEDTHQQLDEALAGVGAARLAAHVAAKLLRAYALEARAAGRSWDDVAAALELPDHTADAAAVAQAGELGVPRAETAFEWLIEDQPPPAPRRERWERPMASWRCSTCRNRVRDHGPFESHPDDREHGHATDCARRRAALEAWRIEQDDEQHEHDDERACEGEGDGGGGRR